MKQKVITAEYRKDSNTFPKWMKYEVTILNEDGTTETIPAYGKDLQDALSRVVHDKKVTNIETKVIKKIPETGWAFAWFLGMAFTEALIYQNVEHNYAGVALISSLFLYTITTLSITNWFRLRNKDK
jgi:hypothetical protein